MAGRLVRWIPFRAALLAALVLGALGGAAASPAASSACIPPDEGPEVCLDVAHTPETVSVSRSGGSAYAAFTAAIRNTSGQTVNHVTLEVTSIGTGPGDEFAFFSATPSTGTCSHDAASSEVRCLFGQLKKGASAQVELVLRAPTVPGEKALDFTAFFDERKSDNPGSPGKVDTVSVTETIVVTPPGPTANSFVPRNAAVGLEIDKNGQEGGVDLPPQSFSTTAALQFTPTNQIPFKCPSICRGGDWFSATIPGRFNPLAEFDLFWPAHLVPSKQTEQNFEVFYVAQPGAKVQIIKARCDSKLSVVPCLKDITEFKSGPLKGSFAATVVRADNGHMR